MHAVSSILLAVVALALGVSGQSATPSTAICPTEDLCGSPLCSADYSGTTGDFTCFYSPSFDVADCPAVASTETDLFCLFGNSDGGLIVDENQLCCADVADTGVRPSRRKMRGLGAAPPTPGGTSPAETLKKRVAYQRARDALNNKH